MVPSCHPKSCSWGRSDPHLGQGKVKGSLVPSSGVTAVLTIPWGRDQTEGQLDGSTLSLETGSCPSALQI